MYNVKGPRCAFYMYVMIKLERTKTPSPKNCWDKLISKLAITLNEQTELRLLKIGGFPEKKNLKVVTSLFKCLKSPQKLDLI